MEITLILIAAIIAIVIAFIIGRKIGLNVVVQEKVKEDTATEFKNQTIKKEFDLLNNQYLVINNEYERKQEELEKIDKTIVQKKEQAEREYDRRVQELNNNIEEKRKAFQSNIQLQQDKMWDDFKQKKNKLEAELNEQQYKLKEQYLNQKDIYNNDIQDLQNKLEDLKQQRAAAVEAARMDEAVQEQQDDYRLDVDDTELRDIGMLESIRNRLSKPRILSMLIWQTYFQPIAKKKFPLILGSNEVCGIYKITNLKTNEVYIGKSKRIKDRWNQHCKCGLGIDTPSRSKLYQSMLNYGLENFAFQLLEKCEPNQLDEREKYYIEAYNSIDYGLNMQSGAGGN